MKRLPFYTAPTDPSGYDTELRLLNEPEPTVQLPLLPTGESQLRVTPGGLRRDWRLARHFGVGVIIVALVIGLLARQPVAPVKVVLTPAASKEPKPSRAPVVPPPSFTTPPAMFQAPPSAPSFVEPPSNAARVAEPVVLRFDSNADLLIPAGRIGFPVPPAVPIPFG